MNDVRREHSSCIMNTKLFVFGGFREYFRLDSIECLETDSSGGSWELIHLPVFTKRTHPAVLAIDDNQIVILGGWDNERLNDVIVYNDDDRTAELVAYADRRFDCLSYPQLDGDNNMVALVRLSSGERTILKFFPKSNDVTISHQLVRP